MISVLSKPILKLLSPRFYFVIILCFPHCFFILLPLYDLQYRCCGGLFSRRYSDRSSRKSRSLTGRNILVGRGWLSVGRTGAGLLEPCSIACRRRHGRCGMASDCHRCVNARQQNASRAHSWYPRDRRLAC